MNRFTLRCLVAGLLSALLVVSAGMAQAAIVNWNGSTDILWGTAGNWDTLPTNDLTTDIANFNLAVYGGNPVFSPDAGTTSINGITIGASNGAMTLTTTNLSIGGSGITIANGAGALTVAGTTVTLGAAQTWSNNSSNLLTVGTGTVANAGNLLTIGGVGDTSVSALISGTGGLTKTGAGTLTLSGANTFGSAVNINGGVLSIGASANLGDASATNTLAIAGGTLRSTGTVNVDLTANRTITLGTGGGTFDVGGTASDFLSLTGVITGTTTLTKIGTGSLSLAADNSATFSGAIDINDGRLNLAHAGGLGTGTVTVKNSTILQAAVANAKLAGVVVQAGGVLRLNQPQDTAAGATVPTAPIAGVLEINNSTVGASFDGIQMAAGSTVRSSIAGVNYGSDLTLNGAVDFDTVNQNFQISGALSGASGAVNKNSFNTLTLSGTNTFSGPVTINAGAVSFGALANLGDASVTNTIALNDGATLQWTGATAANLGTTRTITLNNGGTLSDSGTTGALTVNGVISGAGGLAKSGTGTGGITLGALNTYTGVTTVSAGSLTVAHNSALGANGAGDETTVANNAQLVLANGVTVTGETITIAGGGGTNFIGALAAAAGGSATWDGPVKLGAAARIGAAGNGTLTVSGAISDDTGTDLSISTTAATGTGVVILTGTNTYSGTTNVIRGTLRLGAANSLPATTILDVHSGATTDAATFDLNGISQTIAGLKRTDTTGAGTVTSPTAATLTIDGATNNTYSGLITGSLSLAKNGAGIQTLSGANAYPGLTTISAGALNIQNATALGTTAAGTSIASGAALQIQGGITVGAEPLALNGTGISNDGALRNISNSNTYGGLVTLGSNSRINSDTAATTLTLDVVSGNAITGPFDLAFGGAGNITVADPIATSIGSVTKDGAGTLTLSGANIYGNTFINAGILTANLDANLGSGGGIIFTGSAQLNTASITYNRSIAVNSGVTATFGNSNPTFTGNLTGSGTLAQNTGFGAQNVFGGTANTFEGQLLIGSTGTTGQAYRMAFASFADSATANGKIRFISSSVTHANGSVFEYTGSAPLIINNRQFDIASTGATPSLGHQIRSSGTGALTINTDLLVSSTANPQTLRLNGTNTASTFAGKIVDGTGSAVVSLTKADAGTWILSGANTYTGKTVIDNGTLRINSIKSVSGGASALGAPVTAANGTIDIGNTGAGNVGVLIYTGTGDTTDRVLNLVGRTGGLTLDQSGSGLLKFTSDLTFPGVAGQDSKKTITLQGSTAGTGEIAGKISDSLAGTAGNLATSLTKSGTGSWSLSGANTYTGTTTVNAGRLTGAQTSGTPFGTGATTIGAGILSLAPTGSSADVAVTGGNVANTNNFTFNAGAMFSLNKGTNNSLTYTFSRNNAAAGFSRGTNGTLILSVGAIANLGNTVAGGGERFLINASATPVTLVNTLASGVVAQDRGNSNAGDFVTYGGTNGFAKATYTLTDTFAGSTNTSVVDISTATATTGATAAYAIKVNGVTLTNTGNTLTLGSTGNPAALILNGGAVNGGTLAGGTSEFVVYTSGASSISSAITTSGGMSVFGPGTLDFSGSAGTTYTGSLRINNSTVIANNNNQLGNAGYAITLTGGVLQTSGVFALGGGARNITLAAGQDQTGGTFNVTGGTTTFQNAASNILSGAGSLTKIGAGTLALTGNITNTYTGGTFVNTGVLQLGASDMLADSGAVTVGGGTFDIQGFSDTVGAVTLTSGSITGTTGVLTGSSYNVQSGTASAILGGYGNSLTKTTGGTITLSGSNTFNGRTTISAGILSLTNPLAIQNSVLDTANSIAGDGSNGLQTNQTTLTLGGLVGSKNIAALFTTTSGGYGSVTALTLKGASWPTYSGVIADGATGMTLTKAGLGTQILSGTNSYTGATTVNAGTLQFANTAALYGGTTGSWTAANLNVKSGATLALNVDSAGTAGFDSTSLDTLLTNISVANNAAEGLQAGAILGFDTGTATDATFTQGNLIANSTGANGGAVGVTKLGTGILVFDKANTYTGPTTVSAGALYLTGSLTSPTIATTGTGSFIVGATGTLGGTTSFTQGSTGISTIFGATTYTGPTTISAGTLQIGSGGTTGSLSPSSAITNNGTLIFNRSDTITQGTDFAPVISGSGAVTQNGSSTLVLNGANTFRGPLTVNAGALSIGSINNANADGTLGNSPLAVNLGASTLQYTGPTASSTKPFRLATGATASLDVTTGATNLTLSGLIDGSGNLTKLGAGTLTLPGANTFSGTTTASAGTLALGHSLALQNSALVTTSGTSTISGVTTLTLGGLSGATGDLGSANVLNGYTGSITALTLNPLSGTVTYGGVIADGAAGMTLTKTGAGTQILQGASTYSGATTLSAGTLELSGSGSILNSAITFNGGRLTLTNTAAETGSGRISDSAVITSNGGTLSYVITSGANVYAETIGSVALTSGQLDLVHSINQAGAGSQTLTLAGLTRTGATNTSAVNFASNSGLNTTKNIMVVSGATATTAGQIIGPWATTGNTAGANDYAVYNASSQVVPANMTGTGQADWSVSTDAYNNNVVTQTLGATRTITALRNTAATATLTLATGANLETYGLLNGATTLFTVAPGTGGVLTTPAGGGHLHVNAGNGTTGGAVTINAPISNNGGTVTLVKNGAGTLILGSTTSSYTGDTVINAGIIQVGSAGNNPPDTVFGSTTTPGKIVLNGGRLTILSSNLSSVRDVVVGAAGGSIAVNGNNNFTTSGKLTGSGPFTMAAVGGAGGQTLNFNSTSNDFTGAIFVPTNSPTISFNSLADSANNIVFNGAQGGTFIWGSGATVPLVLNSRSFQFSQTASGQTLTIINNNTAASNANTITVNTDLLVTGTGSSNLVLSGSNTGNNTFAGKIPDGPSGSTSVRTTNPWTLTGANTYSGATSPDNVTLTIRGKQALSPYSTISFDPNSGSAGGGGGVLKLLMDDSGTVNLGNQVNVRTAQTSAAAQWTIFVGNNGGATTDSTLVLGKMSFNSIADYRAAGATINVQGANGYRLQFGDVDLNWGQAGAQGFNPTTAPLTITGTVKQVNGRPATGTSVGNVALGTTAQVLSLGGTNTGNLISGTIMDALDYTDLSNVSAMPLNVTKSNTSVWTLSGTNTYTGATTISGGTLQLGNGGATGGLAGTASITNNANLTVNRSNAFTQATDLNGKAITGTGSFTQAGAGTTALSAANTYAGATTVNAGTLTASGASALGATTGFLAVNNPNTGAGTAVVLNLSTTAPTTKGSLSGTIATPASGTNTATINTQTGQAFTVNQTVAGAYAGVIAGGGSFTLGSLSTNTLTLSGTNTYSGATTVQAGKLTVTGTGSIQSIADVDVSGSATLRLESGTSPALGAGAGGVDIVNNGFLEIASTQAVGDISGGTGSKTTVSGTSTSLTANSIVQDTLEIGAGCSVTIREVTVGPGAGAGSAVGAVPEPATWALIGIGLLSLLAFRRRR